MQQQTTTDGNPAQGGQAENEPDEMERDLAEDAVWKRIQQNTFTRWANEHLKTVNKTITNLETDLSDGLRLIALVEVLSGRRLPKHNARPNFRSQKLENVSVALKFLEVDEGIKIVNIDSTDIVDCKLKLILGLIWTLILHYSISLPMWEGEEGDSVFDKKGGPSPKQRLLGWIQSKLPDLPINNFNSDWNDGRAVAALVDALAPGLCPDWCDMKPENALQNAKEAMNLADNWLGIPQLVKPEEMVNPNVDDLSMMTYLSQYPKAELKPGAPLRPRTNPNRVRCYGPGIEPTGVNVGAPTMFTIETFSAGKGKVEVLIENPKGKLEPVEIKFNDDRSKTYTVTYTAKIEGLHKVKVLFAGKEVPKSPFNVMVEGHAGDPAKVTASGPGLEPTGVMVGKPTYFDIFTKDAGRGQVEVIILDPKGNRNTVPCRIRKTEDNVYRCEYVAQTTGMHSVNVFFAGQQIPKSPFGVKVTPVCDARKVKAVGRGLQKNGIRVKDIADFKIFTENAGNGVLDVKVIGPGGVQEKLDIRKVNEHTYECAYYPNKEGRYIVTISYGGQEIFKSPYEVNVGPYKESRIRVYGPGLYGGVVGYPARFTAETNGETGTLGFLVEGPSHADIKCYDNGDGSADVEYLPTAPGEYAVHILCNDEDIPKSPYMAQILPKTDYFPEKVEAYGPGLQPKGVIQGQPTEFTIDCRKAGGQAPLDVSVMDEDCKPVEIKVQDNKDGTFKASYRPTKNNKHTVQVNYGAVAIPKSPFRVHVGEPTDTNKVKIFGPGVEPGVKAQVPTHFNIDCRGAGTGNVQAKLTDEKGTLVPVQILDNEDGTYSVDYVAPTPGNYKVSVAFAGKEVPNSPIKVKVEPQVDVSKIKVDGLEPSVFIDSPTDFIVDARAVSKRSDAKVQCTIINPSGTRTDSFVQSLNDGTYKICYTPFEEGPHKIDITYDGLPVPGSPFKVNVMRGCDPRKVKAFGPGLEQAIVNQTNTFTVETKGAGRGGLGLVIEGPVEPKMTCRDNRDGSCTVEYFPVEVGMHEIEVKYADQHVPGSPFKVMCTASVDASKVVAHGPGIEPNQCRAGRPLPFTVDARKSGKAPLDVQVSSDKGPLPTKPEIRDNGNGTYDVSYLPPPEGSKCNVKVTYGGKDIPGSPFQMKVKPAVEPKNVKLSGPGLQNKVPASIPVEFTIDTREAGHAEPEVAIKRPDGKPLKATVVNNHDGTYKVKYVPEDVGPHKVSVKYGGQEVPNSPITVNSYAVGHAEKCKITEGIQEKVAIGEEYCITVNADQAGTGAVTCHITSTNTTSDVDIKVEDNGDGTFSIFYSVKEVGDYTISVKFGGNPVPGGSFSTKAVTEEVHKKTITKTHTTQTRTTQFRSVELHSIVIPPGKGQITAEVKMPSGKYDKPVVIDNQDGTISIKYDPKEEGLHELHVKYNQEHIPGSPFKIFVDTISSGFVTAHGPGLSRGVAGEPANFTIYTKEAGAGGLDVAVQGPSQAEITCHDNKDGTVAVNYLPAAPGEYTISVKFAGKHIKGSPFTAKITGEGRKRNQISVGHSSEVSLKVQEKDARNLNASIVSPSGLEEPCFLKTLPNGHLGISFTPREAGEHLVNVKRTGNHIQGSPFKINVLDREIGDASKVKVIGNAIKEGKTHTANEFTIDTREAGFGGLSLSVEGPSKADIQCKDNENGTLTVSYKPTEPGYYIVNLKFADHHVPGSPFTVRVVGEGSNIQREFIKKQRESVPVADVGNECKLTFRLPGSSAFDMSAKVTSPSGVSDDAVITDLDDCLYCVQFVPKEVGVHTVSVRCKDIHIPGSPFQFTVGPFRDHGAHRVHAGGPGLLRGSTGETCEFNVWTREAGAGSLAISVEGPSKADIDFKDCKDGSCFVTYKVSEPGDYRVGIKFNEQHIPDSPFHVYIMPPAGDAAKIELGEIPEAQVNKPLTLAIVMNGAKGNLDGKVITPSGTEDDCFIAPLDADQWALRFIPRENGIHLIHIRCDGIHIPQSPFRLRVGVDDADPAAVHAYGQGLKEAKSGTKMDFIVDTCSAGTGTLAVTIDGPSKVSMDCTEVEEGYKVRYTPLAPGDYFITVKYNGYHISGSPFKVSCTGSAVTDIGAKEQSSVVVETVAKQAKQKAESLPRFKSDANKATCKGIGLKRGHANKPSQFTVNCADAGKNILYCAVYGPKGPCDEVHVKHIGRDMYQVSYTAKERGDHIIIVKYGDDHIPGSPFKVEVV
ncbi:filamin-A-like isoform X2 [Stegodyphus dumicola]|uniref:filamin-A-like isoform X2 n=1 Tax=Stegodyphus dumicola TaxID=202533 RepID=UPI0015AC8D3D|nr:filamin-A-like isoform X2 [Stegodyphus dumicola]